MIYRNVVIWQVNRNNLPKNIIEWIKIFYNISYSAYFLLLYKHYFMIRMYCWWGKRKWSWPRYLQRRGLLLSRWEVCVLPYVLLSIISFNFQAKIKDSIIQNPNFIYILEHKMNVYQSFQIIDIYMDLGTSSLV